MRSLCRQWYGPASGLGWQLFQPSASHLRIFQLSRVHKDFGKTIVLMESQRTRVGQTHTLNEVGQHAFSSLLFALALKPELQRALRLREQLPRSRRNWFVAGIHRLHWPKWLQLLSMDVKRSPPHQCSDLGCFVCHPLGLDFDSANLIEGWSKASGDFHATSRRSRSSFHSLWAHIHSALPGRQTSPGRLIHQCERPKIRG